MEGFLILVGLAFFVFVLVACIIAFSNSYKIKKFEDEMKRTRFNLTNLRRLLNELQSQMEAFGRRIRSIEKGEIKPPAEEREPTQEEVKAQVTGKLVEIVEKGKEKEKEKIEPEKEAVPEEKKPEPAPPPVTVAPSGREPEAVSKKKAVEKVSAYKAAAEKPAKGEWLRKLEETAGKQWITWVGAIVLFLSVGLFVKYAFDNKWLGPTGRVILGVIVGLVSSGFGVYFIRREMRALGQGLVGAGMAILYVSLYASFGIYHLMPQALVFVFMFAVTAAGMGLAIKYNAVPISFIAVLGGLITPALLSTGKDPRDSLFSYILILDLGVLGVAFFKKWRILDILVYVGTWFYFGAWYFKFYMLQAVTPATLWLCLFFLVFLFTPYVYHLRKSTRITGERFFMSVSNAALAFAFAHTMLHELHKVPLGLICLGMSASYLFMGSVTRKRIPDDVKAVFSFIAISLTFLIIAVPIIFDFNAVTVVWALQAPLLLYLGYKYDYLPSRLGALVPLFLSGGRIFTTEWPIHSELFTPVFNPDFGTSIIVAIAGGAFCLIHYVHKARDRKEDYPFMILTGVLSAFLALSVVHIEVWDYLKFAGSSVDSKWACAFVWVAGAASFLAFGLIMKTIIARHSGFVSLATGAVLIIWDYTIAVAPTSIIFLNGGFLAASGAVLVIFAYAHFYRRFRKIVSEDEYSITYFFYITAIFLATLLTSLETYLWLDMKALNYTSRCLQPVIWSVGGFSFLYAGTKLRDSRLRQTGYIPLILSVVLVAYGYFNKLEDFLIIFNGRFLSSLSLVAGVFLYAFHHHLYGSTIEDREKKQVPILFGAVITICTIITSAESGLWLHERMLDYLARCAYPAIWTIAALAWLWTGVRIKSIGFKVSGIWLLITAGFFALYGYSIDPSEKYAIYMNERFFSSLLVLVGSFIYGRAMRRPSEDVNYRTAPLGTGLYSLVIAFLFILLSYETSHWLRINSHFYLSRCLLPVFWSVAGAVYLIAGIRLKSVYLRYLTLAALLVSLGFIISGYSHEITDSYYLYLNGRFIVSLTFVFTAFAYYFCATRLRDKFSPDEYISAWVVNVATLAVLFVILNIETYLYCINTISDPERAHWVGQMSLSIVWGVYAALLLTVGFWRKIRGYRLSALALFGLTSLKLVIIDMAKIKEVYRIISFFILGLLMIGASYLYHKVEKRLEQSSKEDGDSEETD